MNLRLLFRVLGVILAVLGSIIIFSIDSAFRYILKNELTLSPTSRLYEQWRKIPVPITMNVYFFNCTNPEKLKMKNFKPNFVEMGPYTYDEFHEKLDIAWNDNRTVTYKKKITWYHNAESSGGSLDDIVTIPNYVAVGASFVTRYWSSLATYPLSAAVGVLEKTIWTRQKAGEILFDGYSDPILSVASSIPGLSSMASFQDKVGIFYGKNGTTIFDGVLNIGTGIQGISTTGKIYEWNYNNRSEFYDGKCSELDGSAGEFFPQDHRREMPLRVFASQLCRIITLDYMEDTEVHGIPGYRYVLSKSMLDNGTSDPENVCNCDDECLPSGVMNMSACKYGVPAFLSLPHFLDADPVYRNNITGMKPDPVRHRFEIILEQRTGIPLQVAGRMQFNMLMKPNPKIRMFRDVPTILFPLMWFEETAGIPADFADVLKVLLLAPVVLFYSAIVLLTLGLITVVMTLQFESILKKLFKTTQKRRQSEQSSLKIALSKASFLPSKNKETKEVGNSPETTTFLEQKKTDVS